MIISNAPSKKMIISNVMPAWMIVQISHHDEDGGSSFLCCFSAYLLSNCQLGTGGTGTSRAAERPPVSRAPTADRRRRRECRSIRAGCLGHSDSYAQPILMPRPLRCLAVAAAKHAVTAHSIVPPARISSGHLIPWKQPR